jgi:hypothetical protein
VPERDLTGTDNGLPHDRHALRRAEFVVPVQFPPAASRMEPVRQPAWMHWWWVNALLFAATLVSTTVFGDALAHSFAARRPFDLDALWSSYERLLRGHFDIWTGLTFSAPLLFILLTHELGHFWACQRSRVEASLPFFVPSPTLFGTLGAFIRIRSPIYSRRGLFDIGIAGPIAGFLALLPFLVAGVLLSRPLPAGTAPDSFAFGTPLVLYFFEWLRFGSLEPSRILLHPMAMAAWAGLLATAMNLLPIGQLDGGHILYAAAGERWHRIISRLVLLALALLGFLYWPWWFWALLMFFLFRRHPLVYDHQPLASGRIALCAAAVLVFVLSVSLVPIRTS